MVRILTSIIVVLLLLLPRKGYCDNFEYETSYTYGKQSQSDALDEESAFGEFHYRKYRSKIKQDSQNFGYNAGYELYDKNYETRDNLSNKTHVSDFGLWGFLWKNDKKSLKFDTDFDCRVRRFKSILASEYNKMGSDFKLTLDDKDAYSISGAYDIQSFDFTEVDRDEFIQSGELALKNFFFDKKLSLKNFYKLRHRARESDDDRIECIVKTEFDIKDVLPCFNLLRMGLENGKDNTKSYSDEDVYYDFKYIKWYVKTEHEITDFLSSDIKFEQCRKDYKVFANDFATHNLENEWKCDIFKKDNFELCLNTCYGFRYLDYDNATTSSYRRHTFHIEIKTDKKKDWGFSIGFKRSYYDYYNSHRRDKTSYSYSASVDKSLFKNSLKIFADYKHKFKYYPNQKDINEDIIKVGLKTTL